MIVLKATQAQYDALNGYTNGISSIEFATDGNGNYIVGMQVLDDPAFSEIKSQLEQLEQISFVPMTDEV